MKRSAQIRFIVLALLVSFLLFGGQIADVRSKTAKNDFSPPAPVPAAGVQMHPQIAKGGTTSLAVWTDRRTVLGRYVPTDIAGIGSESDIYAARLDADDNLIDTSNDNWFIARSEDFSFYAFPFGTTNDIPVSGDYDGDGKWDAGVFRPSNANWYVQRSTSGTLIQQFGSTNDVPAPSAFVP